MNTTVQLPRWRARAWTFALVVMGMVPAVVRAASTATRWHTLEAIHRVENPRNSSQPGRHGELGAYQFRRTTWRMHSKLPFEQALDRRSSEEVAVSHYEWLKRGLIRNGLAGTPYNIALAWNGGLTAVLRGAASAAAHDYAQRVSNLVEELGGQPLATAP